MPYRRPAPRFTPGPLTAQDAYALNQLAEDLYRFVGGISPSPPIVISDDIAGLRIGFQAPDVIRDITSDGFWGRISGAAGGPNGASYPFIEQYQDDNGVPSDMPKGRQGTATVLPAVPIDGNKTVPLNSIVWLWLSQKKKCYNFSLGGTGGSNPPSTFWNFVIPTTTVSQNPLLYVGFSFHPHPNALGVDFVSTCYIYPFMLMPLQVTPGGQPGITGGTNEGMTLSLTNAPSGGTFSLQWNGAVTALLPFNATAAQIQSALESLPNIGAGNVTAIGGPLPSNFVTIAFTGALGLQPQPLVFQKDNNLTPGQPLVLIIESSPGTRPSSGIYFAIPNGTYNAPGGFGTLPLYFALGGWVKQTSCAGGVNTEITL